MHNLKGLAGNLEAKGLYLAAVELEKMVKGQHANSVSTKKRNKKFAELEIALRQALEAVQVLGSPKENKTTNGSEDVWAAVYPELVEKVADRIHTAAELGDVIQIKSIAEEMMADSDAVTPFCNELKRLADDFDFDGIRNLMLQF